MHGNRLDAVPSEPLHESIRAALGAYEDQGSAAVRVAKRLDEGVDLRLVSEMNEAMAHLADVVRPRLVDVAPGVPRVATRLLPRRGLQGRRAEDGLAIVG